MTSSLYNILINYAPLFSAGLGTTLILWAGAMALSLSIGTSFGILSCKQLQKPYVLPFIKSYIFIGRGVPLYVQLLIMYFVLPDLLNINLPPSMASILALGLCSSAYVAEIVRGGINAIAQGQWDACKVLGFSPLQTLRYIILPQALAITLPAIANELDASIKSTALFAAIGVMGVTKVGTTIVARHMNPVPIYLFIACIYLGMSFILMKGMQRLEKQLCKE